ncbi:acyl-CoA-binding domain-containing protein 4 isoform X2 [Impatiens glandulifera]|uniref:acyl-CoA-binding domain-containing protein 4 isoform X2 n=1 Tax=Impatiens glandulifera TaxID=253017 RepID=UPI001FB08DC1|nr:acyl-CoA-binding domain-containing protein 4 isoform X2 [Impatiens glandulifera]
MFGFSRRRMKLGRLKVQMSDSVHGMKSPVRQPKRNKNQNTEATAPPPISKPDEPISQSSTAPTELSNGALSSSDNWMVLSTSGDKPTPRFNHAAAISGNKMVVVGGETASGLLDDVQVLNFDNFTWNAASSKLYLSPTNLPLKIPGCKGHCLVSWGKKVLLIGGRTDTPSDRISVWAFDTDTECWSLMEAKGDIPISRSGHTVARASSILILFGGEDAKKRKLNDLHMFDLKSLTWLPLHCTGAGPSPRCNHVATLYDDKMLLIFGGASKSRTLNDLYSLDFEAMIWSRIKTHGFHPPPRAGCCGVLCGTKWYITGGGSKKKRHSETLIFDILKNEWSVAAVPAPSSITTNKGFSLVLVPNKERDFLVAFGGFKKEASNQVEVLIMEKHSSSSRRSTLSKVQVPLVSSNHSSSAAGMLYTHLTDISVPGPAENVTRQNLASVIEQHGSGRRSLSESLFADSANVSLRKQFHCEEETIIKTAKSSEAEHFSQVREQRTRQLDIGTQTSNTNAEPEGRSSGSGSATVPTNFYELYETKMAALIRKNGILEGQLAAEIASREGAEKNVSSVLKNKQETEKKLMDALKEVELLREKLTGVELAHEEANNLANIVHSDNVRLEHDVAFLKAVLDDTQKELHSTRGILAGERGRAFQLNVEVFHLKQRLQSMENRVPTPRKPFPV